MFVCFWAQEECAGPSIVGNSIERYGVGNTFLLLTLLNKIVGRYEANGITQFLFMIARSFEWGLKPAGLTTGIKKSFGITFIFHFCKNLFRMGRGSATGNLSNEDANVIRPLRNSSQ